MAKYFNPVRDCASGPPRIPPLRRNVVCVGCSFTNISGHVYPELIKDSEGYPMLLAQTLPEWAGVWNLGIRAGSAWFVKKHLRWLPHLNPDIVIWQLMMPARCPSEEFLELNDIFYYEEWIKAIFNILVAQATDWKERNLPDPCDPEALPKRWERVARNIQEVRECWKCPFIFYSNKHEYPYFHAWRYIHKRLRRELLQPHDHFIETSLNGKKWWLAEHDQHPNAAKQQELVRLFNPIILQEFQRLNQGFSKRQAEQPKRLCESSKLDTFQQNLPEASHQSH